MKYLRKVIILNVFYCDYLTDTLFVFYSCASSQQKTQPTSQVKSDATTSTLVQGLMDLIGPVVRECDERIQNVYKVKKNYQIKLIVNQKVFSFQK
jgi:hypothetical protein